MCHYENKHCSVCQWLITKIQAVTHYRTGSGLNDSQTKGGTIS